MCRRDGDSIRPHARWQVDRSRGKLPRMPAIVPPVGDERDALGTFLAHERHVLVIASYGLTDAQAWSTPAASELSIAGLIEHMASTERTWASMVAEDAPRAGGARAGPGGMTLAE